MSGGIRVRTGPPAREGTMANPAPPVAATNCSSTAATWASGGASAPIRRQKSANASGGLDLGEYAVTGVGDVSGQAEFGGQGEDEGPEPDPLHDPPDHDLLSLTDRQLCSISSWLCA